MSIQNIFSSIILIVIGVALIFFGVQLNDNEITSFCKEHYRDKEFMNQITSSDPPELMQCKSSTWRTGWWQYCDSDCFKAYDKCLEENATEEQLDFLRNCHWMGPDYFIIAGQVMSIFGGVMLILFSIIWLVKNLMSYGQ